MPRRFTYSSYSPVVEPKCICSIQNIFVKTVEASISQFSEEAISTTIGCPKHEMTFKLIIGSSKKGYYLQCNKLTNLKYQPSYAVQVSFMLYTSNFDMIGKSESFVKFTASRTSSRLIGLGIINHTEKDLTKFFSEMYCPAIAIRKYWPRHKLHAKFHRD